MRLRTFLPLLEIDSSEVTGVTEQEALEYQRVLSLAQKACVQVILQGDITSAKLKKIFVEEKCISLEISRLSLKFSLNLYLFQFATCCGNASSQLAEVNIGKGENNEEIVSIIRETVFSKITALMVGFSSETLISQILKEMKEEEKILSFRKSFAGDDINGIDFFFSTMDWRGQIVEIPIQVKTSARGQKYHRGKFSSIPSLYVPETDSREEIMEKILKIGEAYTAHPRSILNL